MLHLFCMKWITAFLIAATLFIGLTYSGKAIFGMGDDMHMGDLECVNHCIDATVVPVVAASAIPILLFVVIFFAEEILRFAQNDMGEKNKITYRRRTEPIRLFLLSQNLSPVIMID